VTSTVRKHSQALHKVVAILLRAPDKSPEQHMMTIYLPRDSSLSMFDLSSQ
jgi:hypothetical protein